MNGYDSSHLTKGACVHLEESHVFGTTEILQHWCQRNAVSGHRIRYAAQLDQRRKHIHQTDRCIHLSATSDARTRPDKRHVRGALPEGMLTPVILFAMMIAVVALQHHDSVVGIWSRLDCIDGAQNMPAVWTLTKLPPHLARRSMFGVIACSWPSAPTQSFISSNAKKSSFGFESSTNADMETANRNWRPIRD